MEAVIPTVNLSYCENPFVYQRRETREVKVGNVGIGGENPIRVQSMITCDTMDTQVVLPDSQKYEVTMTKSLTQQLAEAGYAPADINYLAFSHYHFDHTANANQFVNATWLVPEEERDAMFAKTPPGLTLPSTYSALRDRKTIIIKSDDYDVFGDGTVVIKRAPGHTAGQQVLYLKLAKAGGVVLSGDLYHYPEERKLDRVPTFELDAKKTRETRVAIEAFLKKSGAQLWIQHDLKANTRLKKVPNYYD